MGAGLATRIADFALRLSWNDLTEARRRRVRWFVADYIGSTLAGSTLPEAASGFVLAQPGQVTLPGDVKFNGGGLTPETAAIAMGTCGALLQIHDGFYVLSQTRDAFGRVSSERSDRGIDRSDVKLGSQCECRLL